MKQIRPHPIITITKKGQRSIEGGHPWVYAGEVLSCPADAPNGAIVDVCSEKGTWLGAGLLSLSSLIRVRLLSRNPNDTFDDNFWLRRFHYAWAYRKTVLEPADLTACRVIFGESDSLPGLTVDRFNDILVVQTLSYGMEQRKEQLFPLLVQALREDGQDIRGIYERNDEVLREKEGLAQGKGFFPLPGEAVPAETLTQITENGVRYAVDVENGQKTGFFLDQKYNRKAVARLAKGKRVLDCFTHTGSFALNAALGGAERVTAVDVSQTAVDMARQNTVLNGLEGRMDFLCADVFDLLPKLVEEKRRDWDFIILDPPAFTKSRRTADQAARGYKEINYRAMKLLPRGGYLATCSCSHFMESHRFEGIVQAAARDAGVQLKQIEARQQAPDHPILLGIPETDYLKFYLYQVI
ncbi:MAG: class I SAM-dependent rRNA methyltransferase [Oscillospiraceae bacterium]|nr:class I SAM-dependent rRNA methyltransferase [Oscillospiraceae bacterium]